MKLQDLQAEYENEVIGEKILGHIRSVVTTVVGSYDPKVYADSASWSDGIEDLVQSFIVEVLLEQGQLEYCLFAAENETHFNRLFARQLRFFLARSRRRTVVDNLLDRCKSITRDEPFQQFESPRSWEYELAGLDLENRHPTPSELADVAAELGAIPTRHESGLERAPQIYTTPNLTALLRRVATSLECRVRVRDLDEIFRRLLTPWLPSFLENTEGEPQEQVEPSLDVEQRSVIMSAARDIQQNCTDQELEILRLKLADISDLDIGRRLGLSRPTVAKHKKNALAKVEATLIEIPDVLQAEAIILLGIPDPGGQDQQNER